MKRLIHCAVCNSIVMKRHVLRDGKRLCGRHWLNEGLRVGDKMVVDGQVVAIGTDDKRRNFEIIVGRYE